MKSKKLSALAVLAAALTLAACDMAGIHDFNPPAQMPIQDSNVRFISEIERDELEKNGRFLKLVNMPLNTQTPNVYSVSVANSSNSIARFNKNRTVLIYKDSDSCTAYLLLAYNDESEFIETGFFYTAFTVHVDALTKYIVNASDLFIVSYTDGRGQADVANLPSTAPAAADEPRYLTVFNLPASVSFHGFDKVFVHNQAGAIAYCADYSRIELSVSGNSASAKIPLRYRSLDKTFTETGSFYVSFDINVDAETRYVVTAGDRVKTFFIDGNGYLDVRNLPDNPVPYLTLKGLPLNAGKHQISDVGVYNLSQPVAVCADPGGIVVVRDAESSTFLVPLSYSSNAGSYFRDSGKFAVTFSINVDVFTLIVFTRADGLILPFTDGSAEFDLSAYARPAPHTPYLTVKGLPSNALPGQVSDVGVFNGPSASSVAVCGDNKNIVASKDGKSSTFKIPLSSPDGGGFQASGNFAVTFSVIVDIDTRFVFTRADSLILTFTGGSAEFDLSLHSFPVPYVPYLAVKGLPINAMPGQVSDVGVYNGSSTSSVAGCKDNKNIVVSKDSSSSTFLIPLSSQDNGFFMASGNFAVTFSVIIDINTRYDIPRSDNMILAFTNGSAEFDISVYIKPVPYVPYLTVKGLPLNALVNQVSDVGVYNGSSSSSVVGCKDNKNIVSSKDSKSSTFKIPLSSPDNSYFMASGNFTVTFTIIVDVNTQYVIPRADNMILVFTNGSAEFDVSKYVKPVVYVPYLTVKGLPLNALVNQVSDVGVYNGSSPSSVAGCKDNKQPQGRALRYF
jgi:hypothetical protein